MMTFDEPAIVALGALEVNGDCSAARFCGRTLALTYAQCRVLLVLVSRGGAVVDRETLYREALSGSLAEGSKAVDSHIARIRRALGSHPDVIVSIDRVGYRLDTDMLTRLGRGIPTTR